MGTRPFHEIAHAAKEKWPPEVKEFADRFGTELSIREDRGYAVRLWDRDWLLVAEKPVSQKIESFVAEHVTPGSYLHMTVDRPGGDRWSGRAEVSVTLTSDAHE